MPLEVDPLRTQFIPVGLLVMTPPPAEPAPAATVSRCGAAVNVAVTALVTALETAIVHVPPTQAPLKPSKLPLLLPPPISDTDAPAPNVALHTPLVTPAVMVHEIPDGELDTLPVPLPVPLTDTIPAGGTRYVSSATRACDIVMRQGLPTQSPLHPENRLPPVGICVSDTSVPLANATLHTPDDVPSLMTQLMPAGALVIVPPPRDAGDGVTLSAVGIAIVAKPTPTVVVDDGTTVALQLVPAQAPVNPENVPFPLLTAVSATTIPDAKTAEHAPLATPAVIVHAIPSGALVTLPLPVPNAEIASVPGGCGVRYVASTMRCPVIVTEQGLPMQFVLHVWNVAPALGS